MCSVSSIQERNGSLSDINDKTSEVKKKRREKKRMKTSQVCYDLKEDHRAEDQTNNKVLPTN
jgi:hypothetical protein